METRSSSREINIIDTVRTALILYTSSLVIYRGYYGLKYTQPAVVAEGKDRS